MATQSEYRKQGNITIRNCSPELIIWLTGKAKSEDRTISGTIRNILQKEMTGTNK